MTFDTSVDLVTIGSQSTFTIAFLVDLRRCGEFSLPFSDVRFIIISPNFFISSIGPKALESIVLDLFDGFIRCGELDIQIAAVVFDSIKITEKSTLFPTDSFYPFN